jgi:hypothetical protein
MNRGANPSSIRKKMKDSAFARGVDREDVLRGAELLLGVDLDTHIRNVIEAMQSISTELISAQNRSRALAPSALGDPAAFDNRLLLPAPR